MHWPTCPRRQVQESHLTKSSDRAFGPEEPEQPPKAKCGGEQHPTGAQRHFHHTEAEAVGQSHKKSRASPAALLAIIPSARANARRPIWCLQPSSDQKRRARLHSQADDSSWRGRRVRLQVMEVLSAVVLPRCVQVEILLNFDGILMKLTKKKFFLQHSPILQQPAVPDGGPEERTFQTMREHVAVHPSVAVLRQIFRQQDRRLHASRFQHDSVREAHRRAVPLVHSALPGVVLLHVERVRRLQLRLMPAIKKYFELINGVRGKVNKFTQFFVFTIKAEKNFIIANVTSKLEHPGCDVVLV